LSNRESELKRYRIPDGTKIPAKGYKVIYEGAFNNPATALSPFTFQSERDDQVYLSQTDSSGNITGYRVTETFEASENGVSFGRVQTSVAGDHKFVAMITRTFGRDDATRVEDFRLGTGAPNSGPRIGPVVFNEVHFNPFSPDVNDNLDDQFIELHNITPNPVLLYDPGHSENHWRLQNGISFVFPPGKTIPGFGYALIVSFDPEFQQVKADNFRERWSVPASVELYGPFRGDLNNDGDSLELYRPDEPEGAGQPDEGFVPYIRVDKVNYTDRAPWPATADGTGFSLQRKNPLLFGNDPINWDSAAPTAGAANSAELRDTDGDGMTDTWEERYNFDKTNAADGAPTADADGDSMSNYSEFIAGTDPRNAASLLTVKSITPPNGELVPAKITFFALKGKSYSVQYRNSLTLSANWQKVKNIPAADNDRDETAEDPTAYLRDDRYYRIVTPAAD
jgi:hypothetical protein